MGESKLQCETDSHLDGAAILLPWLRGPGFLVAVFLWALFVSYVFHDHENCSPLPPVSLEDYLSAKRRCKTAYINSHVVYMVNKYAKFNIRLATGAVAQLVRAPV